MPIFDGKNKQRRKAQANADAREVASKGYAPSYSPDGTFQLVVPGDSEGATFRSDKLLGSGQSGLFNRRKKLATRAYQLMAQEAAIKEAQARAAAAKAAEEAIKKEGGPGDKPKPDDKKTPDKKNPDEKTPDEKTPEETEGLGIPMLTDDMIYDATSDDLVEKGWHGFWGSEVPIEEADIAEAVQAGKPYMNINGQIYDVNATVQNIQKGLDPEQAAVKADYGKMNVETLPHYKSLDEAQKNASVNENLINNGYYSPVLVGEGDDAQVFYFDKDGKVVNEQGYKPFTSTEHHGITGSTTYVPVIGGMQGQNESSLITPGALIATAALTAGAKGLGTNAAKKGAYKLLTPTRNISKGGKKIAGWPGATPTTKYNSLRFPQYKPGAVTPPGGVGPVLPKGFKSPTTQVAKGGLRSQGTPKGLSTMNTQRGIMRIPGKTAKSSLKKAPVGKRTIKPVTYVKPTGVTASREVLPTVGNTIKYWAQNGGARNVWNAIKGAPGKIVGPKTREAIKKGAKKTGQGAKWTGRQIKKNPGTATGIGLGAVGTGAALNKKFGGILFK